MLLIFLVNKDITVAGVFKGKSVIAEKFFRTFRIKFIKCMTSVSKKMYIDELS